MFLTALLLFLVETSAQDDCCPRKRVGSVSYTLLPAGTSHREVPSQCLNHCVYTVSGTSSPKFCFATGPAWYLSQYLTMLNCRWIPRHSSSCSSTGDLPTQCLSTQPGIKHRNVSSFNFRSFFLWVFSPNPKFVIQTVKVSILKKFEQCIGYHTSIKQDSIKFN